MDKVEKEKQARLQEYEEEEQEKREFLKIADQWEAHFICLVKEVCKKLGLIYTFSRRGSSEEQQWEFVVRKDEYRLRVIKFYYKKRYGTDLGLLFTGLSRTGIDEAYKFRSLQELSDFSLNLFEYLYRMKTSL